MRPTDFQYSSTNRKKKDMDVISREMSADAADSSSLVSHIDLSNIIASVIAQPSSRTTSIYVGDTGYGSILNILAPENAKSRHITINGAANTALNSEDLEYLKLKGCFELPVESDDLLAAYFHFVHPIFPVIDGPSYLRDYAKRGLERMNLLLLWSVFSVSASYVPTCSGKETKALFVMRGKALFDMSGENDKMVLVQSALLLSFWFDDAEDIKQSWYWTGIAFGIAQSLGLYRRLVSDDQQYNTRGSLWHCCMLRDVWLSYSMGRPLRLDEASCSATLLPTAECRFRDMEFQGNYVYSKAEAEGFEKMWRSSVTIARILRQSLSSTPIRPSTLLECLKDSLEARENHSSSLMLVLCDGHLRLCQNAAMIALCQRSGDKEMAETAADEIVKTVQLYLGDNTMLYVPPTVVPFTMPAMLISVSALKSTEAYNRERGKSRLSCCFQLLDAIEQTYPAASIVKRLFHAAYNTLSA
ncbi:hypothetical protein V494_01158 [Pseudogymnoascus sp. VKM F-4513 (FW-928)]|nr:hypothetical protein V494_01158 [Pseudogymnoascus sp. VKM F-4513 (FW-928)]